MISPELLDRAERCAADLHALALRLMRAVRSEDEHELRRILAGPSEVAVRGDLRRLVETDERGRQRDAAIDAMERAE